MREYWIIYQYHSVLANTPPFYGMANAQKHAVFHGNNGLPTTYESSDDAYAQIRKSGKLNLMAFNMESLGHMITLEGLSFSINNLL